MGFSRHFFKKYNFMLTKLSGELQDIDLLEHVLKLNKETQYVFKLKELADCRDVTNIDKVSAQMTAMSASKEIPKEGSKLAILTTGKETDVMYGMANAYRMFAESRREAIALFQQPQEAIQWLADSKQEEASLESFIHQVDQAV